MRSLGRFVINSTVGIGGLFDVATRLHLPGAPTGFGVTLSRWGVHPGPYLVIPLLGPSTLRDGVGYLGDFGINYGINLATAADSWKVVKRAEELGFTRAWFYDTQLLNAEIFVAMGAAAVKTSRIRLGTGVLIPSNRIAHSPVE